MVTIWLQQLKKKIVFLNTFKLLVWWLLKAEEEESVVKGLPLDAELDPFG